MAFIPLSNEAELLKKISQGDKRAFTTLFDSYNKHLASYVFRLTESFEATEEIVQDVFIKIWLKRDNLTAVKSISDYLFILSRNETLNHLRKRASQAVKFQQWEREFGRETETNETDNYEGYRLLIDKAIDQLPEQQRKAFRLSRFERLKYDEIAQQLNLSIETVRKHIYLANRAIKAFVKDHMDEAIVLILLARIVFP